LGKINFHKFIGNSVAAGLAGLNHVKFDIAITKLFLVLGVSDFVKLMKNGVASRSLEETFVVDVIKHYEGSSLKEKVMFLKFFPMSVSTIDLLGCDVFWARVVAICKTNITRKDAFQRMKEKLENIRPVKRKKIN
jgi:hypothetical protein